jgi:hypothetical protein
MHMLEAYLIGNEQRASTHNEHQRVYYYALHYQLPLSYLARIFDTYLAGGVGNMLSASFTSKR